ncbi:RNA N6-adenosine-methyltransferase METTL16 isoform X1 [Pantherophis guttatus]|uniref:U6 small nuclear RNA (adenine-(43)-N(6))-methyltransferase n=2 Tax=Pantherophis guttatus TaxID=94885 RepID=A0A6P9BPD8_PANGU|nr:RNA N6-adenosine-methyltransferase METTL16 isoform X1 [Pantherophis guttatus]XP_034271849.1 RNA N6-adenosine-methyltransferase METTL16 isoform X1 [Pantherophis guttatus]XP_034271850.1 RNA N6-adenosine-methyltransferase METTL16 isoform X1 [Pantherophis guttatus]XP_034271851.1 RNA N6-adenosine-methyltransferase METTL16 isoform X1 [Pantherophis guttatus]
MALNKSMHERNRYKNKPPDFAFLASKYPEFKQHVQINLSGRVSVNFKDPQAVRALTCTLLKEDFGLQIDIPLERLIPTVPLRLNYIHWVEDLIAQQDTATKGSVTWGIDIGTGASCIYPLLGATLNGWYFIATEVDDVCFSYAKKNVEQNNLSDLIKVVKVPQKTLLLDALEEESEVIYDFCMCNPPFFANQLEAKGVNSRNPRRPPPSSVNTGGITEIMAEGGELEFVKRIIHDSLQLKKRLRWYSCMLGKKCSLAPLKEELRIHGVPKVTHTEFCQGRTMRWALAWSFYENVKVPSPPSKKRKLEKPRKPITFLVLASTAKELGMKASSVGINAVEGLGVVAAWIRKLLTDLKVQHKTLPCGKDEVSLFLTAVENSWIHLRRKKRDRVRQLRELPRASEDFLQSAEEKNQKTSCNISECEGNANGSTEKSSEVLCLDVESSEDNGLNNVPAIQEKNIQGSTEESSSTEEPSFISESKDISSNQNEGTKTFANEILALETGQNDNTSGEWFLFKCVLIVKKEGSDILIEMHWIDGQNRDLMNQLCTYLKNQMFRLITI